MAGRDLYRAWLGCSYSKDAVDCLHALSSAGVSNVDWLLVDHYGLDASWESLLLEGHTGEEPPKLLVIDDLADRPHQANLLIDQNFFGQVTDHRYEGLLPLQCRQFLGPQYALLGPEYAQLHFLVPRRTELHRVLVFFGGVDPDNLSGRTLEALMDPALSHLAVDVVLGRHSPHQKSVADQVSHRPFTTLHEPLPSLAGLIARADLAIGAGGATTWERACLKLPSLVVAIAANQVPFSEALQQEGKVQLLGDAATVGAEQIRAALLARVDDPDQQEAGGDLTDGMGASRVAVAMLGPQSDFSSRPACAGDEALLLRWAYDSHVQPRSFAPDFISPSDTHYFVRQRLNDPNCLLLIAQESGGCPIGLIRFERQLLCAENDSDEAIVDLFLDPCVRGFDVVNDLVRLALQMIEHSWGPDTESVNKALTTDDATRACFSRAGFVQAPITSSTHAASAFEPLALPPGHITFLSDRVSWLNRYIPELIQAFWRRGHAVRWVHHPAHLAAGDVCFMLSCGRLLSAEQLALHRHNLVVHASDLPKGQGWSPMSWQILDGVSKIPVTLFEAVPELDSGPIYLQQHIHLQGNELVEEWRTLLAQATKELCLLWLDRHHEVVAAAKPQLGESSHYVRRRPVDSHLDPERSIAEQFNLLRIVDNARYPAFFSFAGRSFQVHILPEKRGTQDR